MSLRNVTFNGEMSLKCSPCDTNCAVASKRALFNINNYIINLYGTLNVPEAIRFR